MNQTLQDFINFKNSFKGDPKAEVERLLQSGRMSQEQFNALQRQAGEFRDVINSFKL